MGFFSLTWGIWSIGINFCSEFPRSIYSLSKDIGNPNYSLLGLFQTSTLGLGDLVFKGPLSFHGLPQKSSVGISEEDIWIWSQEAHPRCLFQECRFRLEISIARWNWELSVRTLWISGTCSSNRIGWSWPPNVSWYFLGIYYLKNFWWSNRFHRLIWEKLKWQNYTFFFSSISSFELYSFIDVMSSVLIAVIKMPSLSHINCQIKMTQPWPNG